MYTLRSMSNMFIQRAVDAAIKAAGVRCKPIYRVSSKTFHLRVNTMEIELNTLGGEAWRCGGGAEE